VIWLWPELLDIGFQLGGLENAISDSCPISAAGNSFNTGQYNG
jgi:hypothetical protein